MVKESDELKDVPRIKKIDGKYWLVYHTYPGVVYETGLFLERWRKVGMRRSAEGVYHPAGRYVVHVYNAKDTENKEMRWIEQTEFAASKDLLHWERCRENPVLQVNQEVWDARFVSDPYIVKCEETWLDFYFGLGAGHAQEGLALSKDLIHWNKVKEPILCPGKLGEYDCTHAHKASIFYENGTLYYFYCGTRPWMEGDKAAKNQGFRAICVAASRPWPEGR